MESVLWLTPTEAVTANSLVLLRSYLTAPQSRAHNENVWVSGWSFPWGHKTLWLFSFPSLEHWEVSLTQHNVAVENVGRSPDWKARERTCFDLTGNVEQPSPLCQETLSALPTKRSPKAAVYHPRLCHHPFTCLSPLETSSNTCSFSS